MTDRQLEFRVGLFALVACAIAGVLVFQLGELDALWRQYYSIVVHFDAAPGVHPATPVQRAGITIGEVRELGFDEENGGVLVVIDIQKQYTLRKGAQPRLVRSILGNSVIEIDAGEGPQFIEPGTRLAGEPPEDPLAAVTRLEDQVTVSLETFNATADEWRRVGGHLNSLLETNRGNLDLVVERAAESLHQFTLTMRNANETFSYANKTFGNPETQENMRRTLAELPLMVRETRETIAVVKSAVGKADENLKNLTGVTEPLAARSTSIVVRLDNTLANLESLSGELNTFAQLANREDGGLQQFVSNPELYENLALSTASLAVLLKNLEPVMQDLRIFSDKIARHPELMGVGGALNGSSGLKEPPSGANMPRQSAAPGRVQYSRN